MTLFELPEAGPALPERARQMRLFFGITEGKKCGQCVHLVRYVMGGNWFKCELAYQTHGTGTDWRKRWPACGKFKEKA